MVLEMKRALEELKSGNTQGYRRLYDATYEEVYTRSLLIIQNEDQALEYIKDFYKDVFGALEEAEEAQDTERWFLRRYYQKLRKHYHRLLGKQEKTEPGSGVKTLAEIPAAFPLLHRIMLVMSFKDDFPASEISAIYGLAEDKIQSELEKLEKLLPSIVQDQPESAAAYTASWKVLLLGASRQISNTGSDQWVDSLYADAAKAAGVPADTAQAGAAAKSDEFEYFVADPEPEKPKKKIIPIVQEDPEEEDEETYEDDEDDQEYEDDEYDEDEDDEDDDRYDWDMEDDGRKMVILGVVLAVILVAIIGIIAFRVLGKDDEEDREPVQTEQDSGEDDKFIVRGEEDGDDSQVSPEENSEPTEAPVEESEEPAEPEEPQTLVMRVNGNTINVRSEPDTSRDNKVAQVKKDEKVEVLGDPSEEWVRVRCIEQNNEEAYMMSQYLSNIE